ncbi:2-amino-4-hydroxy-6-hydroxymethyldihydropteridine pyrophosphokinase [Ancylobacter novellus DSM 506]|uniref:2-amino-4-hydroxy-6-hydroxymethyldihydropteridine pyrophosphokinase n=1 Tax=Ancylobacter novellus (strain ATCC 8093 / DSM 506 / JCM 20403 / CCM 1077 / IAM 12100 / NBRC 12443 / NCIMB 10456) TaxID=639283 RepID=D7A4U2_ANCN5|nr:2-amino-4-hydroxy-6-hydroxymethyldihydropteridine diphosphokinase [Ancylobacter novellus]ADH87990.1 2-amino-4-hydroxy-6-hydroxymethyldihydropteridine pyrophosphokinase [Ancylobacter novellus DSM 506]
MPREAPPEFFVRRPRKVEKRIAYLCLGSNLGDRAGTIAKAVGLIARTGLKIIARSSLYETPPWGPVLQGPYLNMVVAVETELSARELLNMLLGVEHAFGRDRTREVRFGPRTIDIDILLFGEDVIAEPDLEIPHPRMMQRAFALIPLAELAPDLVVQGGPIRTALEALDRSGIVKVEPQPAGY